MWRTTPKPEIPSSRSEITLRKLKEEYNDNLRIIGKSMEDLLIFIKWSQTNTLIWQCLNAILAIENSTILQEKLETCTKVYYNSKLLRKRLNFAPTFAETLDNPYLYHEYSSPEILSDLYFGRRRLPVCHMRDYRRKFSLYDYLNEYDYMYGLPIDTRPLYDRHQFWGLRSRSFNRNYLPYRRLYNQELLPYKVTVKVNITYIEQIGIWNRKCIREFRY